MRGYTTQKRQISKEKQMICELANEYPMRNLNKLRLPGKLFASQRSVR